MIDFRSVSREFRGLVDRRQELFMFLGSAFAAMGLFLQNVLQGGLPASLAPVQEHLFAFYAAVLMVVSLILALRMSRLHSGMIINGVLYARLMQEQDFARKGDPRRAARHNFLGVSFVQFLLANLIAFFSTAILCLALSAHILAAAGIGAVVFAVGLYCYLRFHREGAALAFRRIETERCAPFSREDWEEHISECLQQSSRGLLAEIAFAGLMVFSGFEALSGLGQISLAGPTDLTPADVTRYGPLVYGVLMTVSCLLELVVYLRVRVAIGSFSLQLDPTDRPFRAMQLSDSFLGYTLLAFLFAVSLHVLLTLAVPALGARQGLLLAISAAALLLALAAEQATLAWARRRFGPPAPEVATPRAAEPQGGEPGKAEQG
ncbi:MAG TPA: hypothetical protein VIL46_02540 [Gemmataceae bacterium]